MEHFDRVMKAYDELVNSSKITYIPPGSNQGQIMNEQKALFTRRAAYYLHQVDSSFGLLRKTSGLNVLGLSVDVVVKPNGDYYDIATDVYDSSGVTRVLPVNPDKTTDIDLGSRWVLPTKELAGLNGTTPNPIPTPPSNNDNTVILNKLDTILNTQDNVREVIRNLLDVISSAHKFEIQKLDDIMNRQFPIYKSSGWIRITLNPTKE